MSEQHARARRPRPLLGPGFPALLGSYALSNLGDAFRMLAVNVWLFEALGGSVPQRLALVLLGNVPGILVGGLAGVAADRGDRFAILLRTDLARIGIGMGLAGCALAGLPVPALVLLALGNALGVLSSAASFAALSRLVPSAAMLRANGLLESAQRLTQLLGPTLAAIALTVGGPVTALLVDSAAFTLSSLLLLGLRRRIRTDAPDARPRVRVRAALRAGLGLVRADARIRAFLAVSAAVAFLTACTSFALGPLVTDVLRLPAASAGLLYGVNGGVALAAAVLTACSWIRAAPGS